MRLSRWLQIDFQRSRVEVIIGCTRTAALAGLFCIAFAGSSGALTIVVDQLTDPFGSDGLCSLREAMFAAGYNLAFDGCPAGDPGLDRIQLGSGTYLLRAAISLSGVDPFIVAGIGVASTQIRPEAGFTGRLLRFQNGTSAAFEKLILAGGDARTPTADGNGGAILSEQSDLRLSDCLVLANQANNGGGVFFTTATGAGALPSHLVIERSEIADNVARAPVGEDAQAHGGGLYFSIYGSSTARIVDSRFVSNVVAAPFPGNIAGGAGLHASAVAPGGRFDMLRVRFEGNSAGTSGGPGDTVVGAAAYVISVSTPTAIRDTSFLANDVSAGDIDSVTGLYLGVSGPVILDRLRLDNEDAGESGRHVAAFVAAGHTLQATNLLLARGPDSGLVLVAAESSTVDLGHLTVTGHDAIGLDLDAPVGTVRLENSILWNAGSELVVRDAPPVQTGNLLDIEPQFVLPSGGNLQLAATSPAVNTGEDSAVTMRFADAQHAPRKAGVHTDRGAFERNGIFADNFDSADTGAWSAAVQ
jgi:hypothetical protein